MRAIDFSARYDRTHSELAEDPLLAAEGFCTYNPTGRVWAREILTEEAQHFFPNGKFMGNWGAPIDVRPADYLAIPQPEGKEVYVIPNELFKKSYTRHNMRDHIPSEAETLAHWETVMRQDARVWRKTVVIHAKVAEMDGSLSDQLQKEERIDAALHQHAEAAAEVDIANEAGVAMVPLKPGTCSPEAKEEEDAIASSTHGHVHEMLRPLVDLTRVGLCGSEPMPHVEETFAVTITRLARKQLAETAEPEVKALAERILALAEDADA